MHYRIYQRLVACWVHVEIQLLALILAILDGFQISMLIGGFFIPDMTGKGGLTVIG